MHNLPEQQPVYVNTDVVSGTGGHNNLMEEGGRSMALKRMSALSSVRNGGDLSVSKPGTPVSLSSNSADGGIYFTALVATAAAIPVAASVFTVILYIAPLPMAW